MKYKELALALAAAYVELVDMTATAIDDGSLRQRAIALLEANKPNERYSSRSQARNVEIRQRYLDGATMREVAAVFGISAERVRQIVGPHAAAQVRAARLEAAKPEPIRKVCPACLKEFDTTHKGRRACSPLCSEAMKVAGLYLRPGAWERHRTYSGAGDVAPNRTYSHPNSKAATILRQIGREDLLRISEPKPRFACVATNLDGTPCKRSVIEGDICHIHRRVA